MVAGFVAHQQRFLPRLRVGEFFLQAGDVTVQSLKPVVDLGELLVERVGNFFRRCLLEQCGLGEIVAAFRYGQFRLLFPFVCLGADRGELAAVFFFVGNSNFLNKMRCNSFVEFTLNSSPAMPCICFSRIFTCF